MTGWKKLILRGLSLLLFATLSGCSDTSDQELEQAMRAVESMTSPSFLSRSCYSVLYPQGKSSDYVSYLFSTLGTAEWPPTESEDDVFSANAGQPVFPEGVAILYEKPDPAAGKQIVVRSDDANNAVIYDGYLKGMEKPVLTRKRQIKSAPPDQAAKAMCESNIQMGATAQYGG